MCWEIVNQLRSSELGPLEAIGLIVFGLLVPPLIVCAVFRSTLRQAIFAWLPTLLLPVFGFLLVVLLIRPFFFEGFTSPGDSMAPTLLGNHFTVKCPTCGQPATGSATQREIPGEHWAICSEFHVGAVTPAGATSQGDKFMVAKYLRPYRWDVIAYRYPGEPSVNYVDRLVGLPGETVFINDGAVWINGQKLDPPPSLAGLKYVTELPHMPPFMHVAGTPDSPAKLGPDEYFVLGDFSLLSMDSRVFQKAAPGHPAYAVPESYIIGVVTHIYWPPSRWRILR